MIEKINLWLNSGKDFFEGVAIYELYGTSKNEIRLFHKGGASRRNRELLEYELRKLIKTPGMALRQVIAPMIRKPVPGPEPKIIKSVFEPKMEKTGTRPLEDDAKKLFEEIRMKLKIRDNLHAILEYLPSDDQRLKDALKILDLSDDISKDYERLRHFDQHGILPPSPMKEEGKKISEMDIAELMTRRQTLRTYISRYTRLRDDAKTPEVRERNQDTLDKYKIEFDEIDNALRK